MTTSIGVPSSPGMHDESHALIEEANGAFGEICAGIDQVVAAVQSFSAYLPAAVMDAAKSVMSLLEQVKAEWSSFVANDGDPDALRAAGHVWATDVSGTAAGLAGRFTLGGLQTDDVWHGRAAEAYRDILGPQQAALTATKSIGDAVDKTLQEVATKILSFVTNVSGALAVLYGAVLGAIGFGLFVVTIPAVVTAIATALVTFLVFFFYQRTTLDGGLREAAAALVRERGNVAFPGGSWPRSTSATTTLDDASLLDGDPTDWRLQK